MSATMSFASLASEVFDNDNDNENENDVPEDPPVRQPRLEVAVVDQLLAVDALRPHAAVYTIVRFGECTARESAHRSRCT